MKIKMIPTQLHGLGNDEANINAEVVLKKEKGQDQSLISGLTLVCKIFLDAMLHPSYSLPLLCQDMLLCFLKMSVVYKLKFGTTRTLPGAGWPSKLNEIGRKHCWTNGNKS